MVRVDILGVEFDPVTLEYAASKAAEMAAGPEPRYIVTPNSEIVYACQKNPAALDAVNSADLVLPDGVGVIHASKILGTPLPARVPGIELAEALFPYLAAEGRSLYLLGAAPGVAERAAENLAARHPGLVICGARDGFFEDDAEVLSEIAQTRPDVVFVCLGAPKQELWIRKNLGLCSAHLLIGLGGSLDIFSGVSRRAPEIFRKLGLEWFYRLLREPWRIGRMLRLPLFLIKVAAHKRKRK